MKIVVFGLGKLGCVIAASYAAVGHEVCGVDLDQRVARLVAEGIAPTLEPGLQQLMDEAGDNLSATSDGVEALKDAQVSLIIVPTPSDANGIFTNRFVASCLEVVGKSLRDRQERHTVVICSTVMPGSCDNELRRILEKASGKRVGAEIGLVYSPEFIALGSVVRDMHRPDLVLIGESDTDSGNLIEELSLSIVENDPEVHRMNLVNAEIVKISINTFVTTKISFANMLGEICDEMQGADADVVTSAIGSDSRIGAKYLKSALGYGGPCFPRDNIALTRLSEGLGLEASIARATDEVNKRQVARVAKLVADNVEPGSKVAVLGLSYKPDTGECEASQGVEIANQLVAASYAVASFDPGVQGGAAGLDHSVELCDSPVDALDGAAVVVVSTPWPEFSRLDSAHFRGKFVVDPWGSLDPEVQVSQLGKLRRGMKTK